MKRRHRLAQLARYWLGMAIVATVANAQPDCFRTAAEAAGQAPKSAGTVRSSMSKPELEGFRLESVRQDPFGGESWASVSWCGHPERPVLIVRAAGVAPAGSLSKSVLQPQRPLAVRAGSQVVVVWAEALVHMQAAGIATASAGIGERLKVRVGEQNLVEGTVRDGQTIEIE